MGDLRLCLLLLLTTCVFAQEEQENAEEHSCSLAIRFKSLNKYVYQYEAENLNGVTGTSDLRNGPKVACQVEIEVPQTCSYIVRTTECTLSEVSHLDDSGMLVYIQAAGAEDFKAAMTKHPLKLTVEGESKVSLFPEEDEPTNILNIKRGIVSALLVPVLEDEGRKNMATVHGVCNTDYAIDIRDDTVTEVAVTRDLSYCDSFSPSKGITSPLALISGLHFPLSKLISSTQTCNYKFDNEMKYMTEGSCTEKHILLPFSHQEEYGISTLVKQTLTLKESSTINNRVFEYNEAGRKSLTMEAVEDKSRVQKTDALLATLRELSTLSENKRRVHLFQKLKTEIRGLRSEALSAAVPEMMEVSGLLTWQALAQCGTPECSSAILQILRTMDKSAVEVDAAVYAMGLLSTPDKRLVRDMLSMAQYKQSKPILYTLSNIVRRFYQAEGKVTDEIIDVAQFLASLLGEDCSGDKDQTFLVLRVIGNMGKVMEAANPELQSTLLKCMRQPVTTLAVQQAAIQAFRQMTVTGEVRTDLQKVFQYGKGPVQKRIAAYLILMKNPEVSDLGLVKTTLEQEENLQVMNFVASHIHNIISSKDTETEELRRQIMDVMQDQEISTHYEFNKLSRNYKMDASVSMQDPMMASVQGNMIFDPSSYMPKEVMLETTLKAFGYSIDMMEVGLEGKGFEPTVEALFGENGFFPDTISKAMYWATNKMPNKVKQVLNNFIDPQSNERMKRQAPENIMREITRNANKLIKELQTQDSPEATAYLRILGAELGYLKASDLKNLAQFGAAYAAMFPRMMPPKFLKSLMSSTDNELFLHYIFMDNSFSLSTGSGLPLKVSLAGTMTPGAKGGIRMEPRKHEISFMPSIGVEFVTQMGVDFPELVAAGIEMHTSLYHESAIHARLSMKDNQIKLSIPAPKGSTQLLAVRNTLYSISSDRTEQLTSNGLAVGECSPLFTGVKYCTSRQYAAPASTDSAPYFPLNGKTAYDVTIKPSGEVTEYSATISYDLEGGEDGQEKVDVLKMVLKAEGADAEAVGSIKYNRDRNSLSSDIKIPDYDIEAGIRLGVSDSSSSGKELTLDITNKNTAQLSVILRAKLEATTDGMLQLQLLAPIFKTDATVTATLQRADGLTLELESVVNIPETTSLEKVTFRYDENRVEVEYKSDLSSEIQKLYPYADYYHKLLQLFIDDILDTTVPKTDMNIRHIYSKSLEAGNIWLDKIAADVPHVEKLRSFPGFTLPSVPEKLFLKSETLFRYRFNKDRLSIVVPLPLGGQSSTDLHIPPTVTIPHLSLPKIGLEIPSKEIRIPTFSIPPSYELQLPLMGMAEASSKLNSNFYNWEGTVSMGNNIEDKSSYIAKYQVMADCPLDVLSYRTEGTALLTDEDLTAGVLINGSLSHKFLDASFSFIESSTIGDKVKGTGKYKIEASSPMGLSSSVYLTTQMTSSEEGIKGDANMDGAIKLGSLSASSAYSHSLDISLDKVRGESTLRVDTPLAEIVNKMKGAYVNEEFTMESTTDVSNKHLKHVTKVEISYKDSKVSLKSDSETNALSTKLQNLVALSASAESASIRVQSQADNLENRGLFLLSGSLDARRLEINTDASLNFNENQSSHKGTLMINSGGLSTSGNTILQYSPLKFENTFDGGVDGSGVAISLSSKGNVHEHTADLSVEGKIGGSGAYLKSALKGLIFDADSRNTVMLKLDHDGLTFSNDLMGSLHKMKTENKLGLTLTFWTLAFQSKTDSSISDSTSYRHDITVDLMPFITSVNVENDLKMLGVDLMNKGQFKLEPFKMDLKGNLRGALGAEQIRHTYEIGYENQEAKIKCSTSGQILGTSMSHETDLELSGLSCKLKSEANVNSKPLRLNGKIELDAAPFDLSIDGFLNSDGDVELYGKHTGHLSTKVLLKAEPLSITYTHNCKASTTHVIDSSVSAETSFDSKVDCAMNLQEQKAKWEMKSTLNNHEYMHAISTSNDLKTMGMELSGKIMTDLLNRPLRKNQEFTISGFLKYDKNNDGHIINLPFIEDIPAIIEQLKTVIVNLRDSSVAWLEDFDFKYKISARIQEKVNELKEVLGSFDITLFVEDLRNYVSSIDMENKLEKFIAQIPTDKLIRFFNSQKEKIIETIEELEIAGKISAIHTKVKEMLQNYEIEKIVEAIMEKASELIKRYKVNEKIQSFVDAVRSIDSKGKFEKAKQELSVFIDRLKAVDFRRLIRDFDEFLDRIIKKIQSFDYKTFAEDVRQNIRVPALGKLHGEIKLVSPQYELKTNAQLSNATTNPETPQLSASLTSEAKKDNEVLAALEATAQLAAPKMERLVFSELLKVALPAFSIEHHGATTFYESSISVSGKTAAKAVTEPYTADLTNTASFVLNDGTLVASMDTTFNHNLNMPLIDISSHGSATQTASVKLESNMIYVEVVNTGDGSWSYLGYADEGTHKSELNLTVDTNTAKLTFRGNTDSGSINMEQIMTVESAMFSHVILDASAKTETPFIKSSVAKLNGKLQLKDLKIELIGSHATELTGRNEGTLLNTINFVAQPFEVTLDTKNNGKGIIKLPFKLMGKWNFQHDFNAALNSEGQKVILVSLAKFNQYQYSHRITMDNNKKAIVLYTAMDGEANLDLLTIPISIPQMTVPLIDVKTPYIESFSLWEDTGLKSRLATTQQSVDLNFKLQYQKNPETYTIYLDTEPVYKAIDMTAKIMNKNFEIGRDIALALVRNSYNQAEEQIEKIKVDSSEASKNSFTIPGYTIPILNIDVAAFTAELPAVNFMLPKEIHTPSFKVPLIDFVVPSYIAVLPVTVFPVVHVPAALEQLTLPRITLPALQDSFEIPAMGNMTYEFSFKSSVLTVNSNAGLYNKGDIVAQIRATSSSVFLILKSRLDGMTTLTMKRGLKVVNAASLEHATIRGTHKSAFELNSDGMETSVANNGRISLPSMPFYFDQKFNGNSKDGISASVFSRSAGFLGLELRKSHSQLQGELFGRYPSAPENDVEILTVKASLKNPEKLNLQTSWSAEVPQEILLGLKEMVSDFALPRQIMDAVENTKRDVFMAIPVVIRAVRIKSEQIFNRAAEYVAESDLQEMTRQFSEFVRNIVDQYQTKVKEILDAVIEFLGEAEFQLPGVEEKLTGFEIYQKVSHFVASVLEDAIRDVPNRVAIHASALIKLVEDTVITLPGSNHLIVGKDVVDDLKSILEKVQSLAVELLRDFQAVRLEDMLVKLKDFLLYTARMADDFITSIMSQKAENLTAWAEAVLSDAWNSEPFMYISAQLSGVKMVAKEKLDLVESILEELSSQITVEALKGLVESWIDALVRALNSFNDEMTARLNQISQTVEPYMSVSDNKVDIEIPIPFAWKSPRATPIEA